MTAYTKTSDFAIKDSLLSGNPSKVVRGTEIDTEFNAIQTADADNVKISGLGMAVATFLGTPSSANLAAALTDETGTGLVVFSTSPTLVTPALGTPSALVGTNITGTAAGLTAGNVTTNANLTGHVTSTGNAAVLGSFTVAQLNTAISDADVTTGGGTATGTNTGDQTITLTGGVTGSGTGSFAATVVTNANLTGHITSVGNAAVLGSFTAAQLNTAVSDADVATIAGTETLTNKTLTSPVINTPTGIVKGDVGLGNVDNTSDATKNAAVATLTNKTLTSPDINGGTIDGAVIGGAAPAAGSFTTVSVSGVASGFANIYGADGASIGWGAGTTAFIGTSAGQTINVHINGVDKGQWNSTGLSVTGSVSASGSLTTAGLKEDAAGNLGIGGTPSAWASFYKGFDLSTYSAVYGASTNNAGLINNGYYNGSSWIYKNAAAASNYFQSGGTHAWNTAPSGTAGNPITFGDPKMTLDASGNWLLGTTSASGKATMAFDGSAVNGLVINNSTGSGVPGLILGQVSGSNVFVVANSGNVTNTNNSYGAISDVKLKENIVDCTPKLSKLLQVRIVNYNIKTDPEHKQIGVIAQELEQISPGLIEETPDYINVTKTREVTKTRTIKVPTQVSKTRQATEVTEQEQTTTEIVLIDGVYVQQTTTVTVQVSTPLFDTHPVFDGAGQPVMVVDVPEHSEGEGDDAVVVPATYKQLTHQTPRMESCVETVDVDTPEDYTEAEDYTEREATGEVTKSVKYSVFVPMLIKAMQEQQALIVDLETRLAALEAA